MSTTSEVQVGITVCLDAVTQAFKDGEAIIEKIKKKRAQKRAPAPPRLLEESISQAPEEIAREKRRGVNRFGKAFEDGDHIAVIALQQITIELQRSLLDKLKNAAFDDDNKTTDFMYLVDAADTGRDRTIAALHELRQRLINAQSSETAEQLLVPVPPTSASSSASNVTTPPEEHKSRTKSSENAPKPQLAQPKTWSRESGHSRDASGEEDAVSGAEAPTSNHHRKSSLLSFLKHRNRTNSSGAEGREAKDKSVTSQPIAEEGTSPTTIPFRPPPQCDASTSVLGTSPPGRPQQSTKFRYEEWEDNSSEIWGKRPSLDRHHSMAIAPDQPSDRTASTANINFPLQPPSPIMTNRTNSTAHSHMASTAVPIPNPENEYLGFCKGAVKLQNGDRKGSMHKCREVEPWSRHPSAATSAQYLACQQQKCAFRSSFSHQNTEVIWKRVFTLESKGMKVRWQFLAKSHVLQKVVVKHQYSFKCLFCVFMGLKSGVYHGIDYYLEHILSEHRGKPLGDVILYKTGCINDRVANDDEEFDINLWPGGAKTDQKQPEWLSDDLIDPSAKEPNDSMFSNEPWNEGLSDFHYGGGQFEEEAYLRDREVY